MPKTFAQYLIENILPPGITLNKQVDKSYLEAILLEVQNKYPDKYAKVVVDLKNLGDKFSTYEPITMGLAEIATPNIEERDKIIANYTKKLESVKDNAQVITVLSNLQQDLAANDLKNTNDDASTMVRSAMGNSKYQLMKLRTSPGVVSDHAGNIVPEIFPKSYAEGVDPLHFWLGATESRKNISEGQVATAKPGEMNKVISNILGTAVVTTKDCGTGQGIILNAKDDDIIGRYTVKDKLLVDADYQQKLLKQNIPRLLVRSPQTCQSPGGSVCQLCMGLRTSTGKLYQIGDNAGMITSGALGEPLTQMSLSAKHSTSLAKAETGLSGEAGLRKFVESPKNYANRKVLCEVNGIITRIRTAPQGGLLLTIRQTRPVPERYIVHAMPTPNLKLHVDYHIPPNLKLAEGIAENTEVWPGLALSTGIDNIQDIARLRNLGMARTAASQNMYDIYKNTGNKLDRKHFELLARNSHPYVKLEKVPANTDLLLGDTIEYNVLVNTVKTLPKIQMATTQALGKVLGTGVLDISVGTDIDSEIQKYLLDNKVDTVSIVKDLEVSAVTVPLTRVINKSSDWLAAMNHRYLKDNLRDAASFGQKSNLHGYSPHVAYAYGLEMGHGEDGKY